MVGFGVFRFFKEERLPNPCNNQNYFVRLCVFLPFSFLWQSLGCCGVGFRASLGLGWGLGGLGLRGWRVRILI